jgi:Putative Ig domain
VLTLTGKDTPQDYQTALSLVTMSGNAPNGGPATITWQMTDQNHLVSKTATSIVEVAGSLVPPLIPQVQAPIPGNFDHGHFGDFSGMLTNAQFGGPAGLNFGAGGAVNVIHLDVNATVADNGTIGFDVAVNQLEAALDGDVVSVTATLADGKPLPGWLNFDSDTGQFAGLLPDNFATGSIGHDGGFSDGQGGSSGPQLMTIEVIARDSKGNLAITDFTIDLSTVTAHRGDRHGWNLLPLGPHRDIGPLHAMNSPMDHVLWHGVPDLDADRVHAGHHGSDVAPPAGRAGFSDQIKAHGWNAVAAQRMALLDSLRQGVAGWR